MVALREGRELYARGALGPSMVHSHALQKMLRLQQVFLKKAYKRPGLCAAMITPGMVEEKEKMELYTRGALGPPMVLSDTLQRMLRFQKPFTGSLEGLLEPIEDFTKPLLPVPSKVERTSEWILQHAFSNFGTCNTGTCANFGTAASVSSVAHLSIWFHT